MRRCCSDHAFSNNVAIMHDAWWSFGGINLIPSSSQYNLYDSRNCVGYKRIAIGSTRVYAMEQVPCMTPVQGSGSEIFTYKGAVVPIERGPSLSQLNVYANIYCHAWN